MKSQTGRIVCVYVCVRVFLFNCHAFLDCRRMAVVLRSIPKEAFADRFQKLYERCQPCVVKDGDYFEGQ
jgi:hypothetical protein